MRRAAEGWRSPSRADRHLEVLARWSMSAAVGSGFAAVSLAVLAANSWQSERVLTSSGPSRVLLATTGLLAAVTIASRVVLRRSRTGAYHLSGPLLLVVVTALLVDRALPTPQGGFVRAQNRYGIPLWAVEVRPWVSEPVVAGDLVLVRHATGCDGPAEVTAFHAADGGERWSRDVTFAPAGSPPVWEPPAVVGFTVAIADSDTVVGVDVATGGTRWEVAVEPTVGPVATATHAIVVTEHRTEQVRADGAPAQVLHSQVTSLDAATGSLAWTVDLPDAHQTISLEITEEGIMIGQWGPVDVADRNGAPSFHMVVLDMATGAVRSDDAIPGPPRSPEAVTGPVLVDGRDAQVHVDRGEPSDCSTG